MGDISSLHIDLDREGVCMPRLVCVLSSVRFWWRWGKDKSCQIERVCAPLFTDTFCVCETVNVLGLVAAEMRLL